MARVVARPSRTGPWGRIAVQVQEIATGISSQLAHSAGQLSLEGHPPAEVIALCMRSAFQVGVELGAGIGHRDAAAAERYLAFADATIHDNRAEDIERREEAVAAMVRAIRVD